MIINHNIQMVLANEVYSSWTNDRGIQFCEHYYNQGIQICEQMIWVYR